MAKKKGLTKREQKKVNKFILANWKVCLAIFLVVVTLAVVAYFMGWLDILFKKDKEPPILSTAGGHITEVDEFKDLQINFLDVGQGDCIVIELPDDKTMMIDTGDTSNANEQVISEFLASNNITYIDYFLLTHSDEDHVGNADWLIDNYAVRYIFRPNVYSVHSKTDDLPETFNRKVTGGFKCNTVCYSDFLISAYNEQDCTIEYFNKDSDFTNTMTCNGESMTYTFDFLTPVAKREDVKYGDPNNYSPIMTLEYAGKKVMFTGDAEEDMIEEFCENYGDDINVDILKVGHHGSENATTDEFVADIDPEYAVIQCGKGNDYGHPHKDALDRLILHDSQMKIYRNDTNGDITISISASGEIVWQMENTSCVNNLKTGAEIATMSLGIKKSENDGVYLQEVLSLCIMKDDEKRRFVIA